jgi:hypothetical protein
VSTGNTGDEGHSANVRVLAQTSFICSDRVVLGCFWPKFVFIVKSAQCTRGECSMSEG